MFLAFILDVAFTLSLCVLSSLLPPAHGNMLSVHPYLPAVCEHMHPMLDAYPMVMRRLGFLGLHGRMVAKNCTTIEMFEKSRIIPWPYDHGWRRNFQEVFGRRSGMLVPAMHLPLHSERSLPTRGGSFCGDLSRSFSRWVVPSYSAEERRELLSAALRQRSEGARGLLLTNMGER